MSGRTRIDDGMSETQTRQVGGAPPPMRVWPSQAMGFGKKVRNKHEVFKKEIHQNYIASGSKFDNHFNKK